MASVSTRTLKNGTIRWRVNYRVGDDQKQETFDNPKGAAEFGNLVDRIGGLAASEVLKARRGNATEAPTLRDFTAQYLDPTSGLLTGIEPGTRAGYEREAKRSFLIILGDYPVDTITKADVGRWLAWQEAQPSARSANSKTPTPVAAKTVRNYHALLSSVLAASVESKHRTDNPAFRTRLSKGMKREGVFLSVEEFTTLLHFIPTAFEPFVLFLAGTGCRWGEATAIEWRHLNLTANPPTARIEQAWKKSATGAPVLKHPKSSRSRRTVSLFPDLVAALGKPGPATSLVFPAPNGNHMWHGRFHTSVWTKAVAQAMDPAACEREGLTALTRRPSIHDLRHTHASWLISAGTPLPYVQARLGHESITTTVNVYGHLIPEAHSIMAGTVAGMLEGVRPMKVLELDPA